jgi:hypothetical protein
MHRATLMQGGYEAVMLGRDGHEHNVMCGELPGGEHGVLFHELAAPDGDGERAQWTTAAVLVPEATATVRRLRIDHDPELDRAGADHAVFSHGTLAVRRPGWEPDPDRLDAVATAASALARRLRSRAPLPQPFATTLPPPTAPVAGWEDAIAGLAARLGLEREDPITLHAAFPSLPVPGEAFAVLRGTLPDAGTGRVVLTSGRPVESWNLGRNAILLPARPGTAETPPEGVIVTEARLRRHVCGDIAVFHVHRTGARGDVGDVDSLIARAAKVAHD